ncbi:ABC transporter substrate-binding protein [Nocardioides nematodiphilus]|uniref:ABC transporter substrate-binding protein n=1 Tax=Nocardioides nematodiphilus TaxID=2849669 RepID=UPI001CDA227D|nr:ABC transporter substrate-binding protein [Nocardioides nematodiphilus]MCA1983121.1 ABC transporter substrate-binding protein [Nocardioides nematodiphilus]
MTRTARARVKLTAGLLASLALVGSATACASSEAAAGKGKEVTTIRYQSYAGGVDSLLLADALGDLKGLTLKRVGDITGGPQALQALVSNQTDIGGSAFYGAIAQLVSSGARIKAVFPSYGSNDKIQQKLAVPEDSSIKTARDLIGKKIAVNTLGANSEAIIDTWLAKEGLSQDEIKKVTLVVLPPLNMPEALAKGQVDAAALSFLGYKVASQSVKLRNLVDDTDVVGGPYAGGGYTLRDDFIKANPNTSRELIAGIADAVEFIETHSADEVFKVLFPYLEKHGFADYEDAIKANFPGTLGLTPKPVIADGDITRWTDWLSSHGDIAPGSVKPSDVYTNELNPWADGGSATSTGTPAATPSTGGAS